MAGYWPHPFLHVYFDSILGYKHTKEGTWPISSHLDLVLGLLNNLVYIIVIIIVIVVVVMVIIISSFLPIGTPTYECKSRPQ